MTPKEQTFINVVVAQRNDAMNAICSLQAELAERDEKIKELDEKIKTL